MNVAALRNRVRKLEGTPKRPVYLRVQVGDKVTVEDTYKPGDPPGIRLNIWLRPTPQCGIGEPT